MLTGMRHVRHEDPHATSKVTEHDQNHNEKGYLLLVLGHLKGVIEIVRDLA